MKLFEVHLKGHSQGGLKTSCTLFVHIAMIACIDCKTKIFLRDKIVNLKSEPCFRKTNLLGL